MASSGMYSGTRAASLAGVTAAVVDLVEQDGGGDLLGVGQVLGFEAFFPDGAKDGQGDAGGDDEGDEAEGEREDAVARGEAAVAMPFPARAPADCRSVARDVSEDDGEDGGDAGEEAEDAADEAGDGHAEGGGRARGEGRVVAPGLITGRRGGQRRRRGRRGQQMAQPGGRGRAELRGDPLQRLPVGLPLLPEEVLRGNGARAPHALQLGQTERAGLLLIDQDVVRFLAHQRG